jgi:hypothetical protein
MLIGLLYSYFLWPATERIAVDRFTFRSIGGLVAQRTLRAQSTTVSGWHASHHETNHPGRQVNSNTLSFLSVVSSTVLQGILFDPWLLFFDDHYHSDH